MITATETEFTQALEDQVRSHISHIAGLPAFEPRFLDLDPYSFTLTSLSFYRINL